jgi:hypothetical protein
MSLNNNWQGNKEGKAISNSSNPHLSFINNNRQGNKDGKAISNSSNPHLSFIHIIMDTTQAFYQPMNNIQDIELIQVQVAHC